MKISQSMSVLIFLQYFVYESEIVLETFLHLGLTNLVLERNEIENKLLSSQRTKNKCWFFSTPIRVIFIVRALKRNQIFFECQRMLLGWQENDELSSIETNWKEKIWWKLARIKRGFNLEELSTKKIVEMFI